VIYGLFMPKVGVLFPKRYLTFLHACVLIEIDDFMACHVAVRCGQARHAGEGNRHERSQAYQENVG
jgi:hypothetical protein